MIKMFLFVMLLALVSAPPAHAQSSENLEICRQFGDTAVAALEARYRGVTLIQLLEAMRQTPDVVPAFLDVAESLAIDAYGLPEFATPEMRARQIQEFRNRTEQACVIELR